MGAVSVLPNIKDFFNGFFSDPELGPLSHTSESNRALCSGTDPDSIRQSYKRLATKCHPEKHRGSQFNDAFMVSTANC